MTPHFVFIGWLAVMVIVSVSFIISLIREWMKAISFRHSGKQVAERKNTT
jgi:hypothetical protein